MIFFSNRYEHIGIFYRSTEENYNQIAYGGLLLLDNILGEYDCVTKVRNYDFQNMPTKQDELKDFKPFLGLAEYVDNFHKAKHN